MDMEKEPPPRCSLTQDKLKSAPPPLPGVSTPSKRSSDEFLAEKAAVQQLLSSLSESRENSRQPSMTRAAAAAVRGPPLTAAEREAKEAERKAAAAKFKKEKAAMQERLRSPPIRDRGAYEREATEMRLRLNTQHKEKASAAEVADQEARAAMQTAAAALQAARELEMKAVNMLEAATTIIHTMRRRLKRRRRRAAVAIQSRLRAHFCASNQICSSRAVLFILRGSRSAHARAIRRMMAARRANGIAAGSSGGSADEGKVAAMQQVTRRSMRIV